MAAAWPERLRRGVTMAVPPPATIRAMLGDPAQLRRFLYMFLFQVPGVAEAALAANALRIHRGNVDTSPHDPALAPLAEKTETLAPIPLLVLAADDDGCIPPGHFTGAERGLAPGSRVQTVAEAGHFTHLDRPDEIARLALEWFGT
ncbi:alpha/beta fold hydrolase [Actinophytocola sp.]|uniref:alpha/beta fold hydrolase n=1 Tax=Actinophytocola sp. TaxID=1872138 RepID=UPI003D6A6E76